QGEQCHPVEAGMTPRHVLAADKEGLRRFLQQPIRTDQIPEGQIRVEQAMRDEALFALHDIPADFPLDVQWELLARALAYQMFKACRIISRGSGGPSEERREKQRDLFREFKRFEATATIKGRPARLRFLKQHRTRCAALGFSSERSFAQALAKFE